MFIKYHLVHIQMAKLPCLSIGISRIIRSIEDKALSHFSKKIQIQKNVIFLIQTVIDFDGCNFIFNLLQIPNFET